MDDFKVTDIRFEVWFDKRERKSWIVTGRGKIDGKDWQASDAIEPAAFTKIGEVQTCVDTICKAFERRTAKVRSAPIGAASGNA